MVANDVVESRKVFGPSNLSSGELFQCGEVFKILVVGEHKNDVWYSFEIVLLLFECLVDCEQFFVIDFIVQFGRGHSPGVEGDWMNVTIFGRNL